MLNNPLAVKEDCAELEIFEMDGDSVTSESTGLILLIRPPSHPDVKKLDKKIYSEVKSVKNSEKMDVEDYMFERADVVLKDRVRSHIEGWRWSDNAHPDVKEIKFSGKMLNEFLDSKPFGDWIARQVIKFKAREANFYKRPAKD